MRAPGARTVARAADEPRELGEARRWLPDPAGKARTAAHCRHSWREGPLWSSAPVPAPASSPARASRRRRRPPC